MKYTVATIAIVLLVPALLVIALLFGHPMNFPNVAPHDFAKRGYKSEMKFRAGCAWLIFCEAAPYKIELLLPKEGNFRYLERALDDAVFPGRYRIIITSDRTSEIVLDEIVVGGQMQSQGQKSGFYGVTKNEPLLATGRYSISVENLENNPDFDNLLERSPYNGQENNARHWLIGSYDAGAVEC